MRYTWPKTKLCRREWVNLFGTEKYDLSQSNRAPLKTRKNRIRWAIKKKTNC